MSVSKAVSAPVSLAFASLMGIALLWVATEPGRFLTFEWTMHLVRGGLLLFLGGLFWFRQRSRPCSRIRSLRWVCLGPLLLLTAAMVCHLASSSAAAPMAYFVDWARAARTGHSVLASGLFRWLAWTAVLTPFLLRGRRRFTVLLLAGFVVCQFLCFRALIHETGGAALCRDDHPSFLFRIHAISETFPRSYNYSPHWNAGVADFVETQTGANAFAFAFLPVLNFLDIRTAYTWLYAIMFIVLLPWVGVLGVRAAGAGWAAAFAGGLLCLGVSRESLLWALHFGTIGAAVSCACLLPVSASVFRVMQRGRGDRAMAAVLVGSGFFMLLWPGAGAMAAAVAMASLVFWRRWSWPGWRFLLLCALLLAGLLIPPYLPMLANAARIAGETAGIGTSTAFELWPSLVRGGTRLCVQLREMHPLLLFLGMGGLWVGGRIGMRIWFGVLSAVLALIVVLVPEVAPDLQMHRMSIPLAYALVVPAVFGLQRLLSFRSPVLAPVRSGLIVLLLMGGLSAVAIYRNRQQPENTRYRAEGAGTSQLVDWIRGNVPENGRVLFAGSSVHAYDGGHVAPLPLYTGREMMGCDYYHFPPSTVEYEYPPRPFRKPQDRVFEFCDLHNVTHVIAWRSHWVQYFQSHPDVYTPVAVVAADSGQPKQIFSVKRTPSLFVKGDGRVTAEFNRITVVPGDPDADMVIKYNWVDGLRADLPAELYPVEMGDGIRFIGIRPHGAQPVHIRFHRWL